MADAGSKPATSTKCQKNPPKWSPRGIFFAFFLVCRLRTRGEVVAKRSERKEDKAKIRETAEFIIINEHVELIFNAVLLSAVVLQQALERV